MGAKTQASSGIAILGSVIGSVKHVFYPAPDPNGFIGNHAAIVLTDGVDITVRMEFAWPFNTGTVVAVEALVVPGGTGNLRRGVETDFAARGEVYNLNSSSIAAGQVAVTANEVENLNVSAALPGIDEGDIVGLEFTRYGSNALDTVNADCYFLGILLTRS